MIALEKQTQFFSPASGIERSQFLFIASDYKPWPGGIGEYIDALARGLIALGDRARVLAVIHPEESQRLAFLESYEPWVMPLPVIYDSKPTNWLGRKCLSLLEIARCLSPNCRRVLKRSALFKASTASVARLHEILSEDRQSTIVFGNLEVGLYSFALYLLDSQRQYGIIAHGSEIGLLPNKKKNDFVKRKTILQNASWIAANSRDTKSLVESWGVHPDKIKIINPPISEEAMRESASLPHSDIESKDLRLVTISRLVRGKGIDIVLRALKLLSGAGIPFRYVIGGDGPERSYLEELVRDLGLEGRVQFKGMVAGIEKWQVLRDGDIFVMPSRFDSTILWRESFGIAFAEAAAFGLPAVGSTSGGILDAVIDGETGILVPEESAPALADALTYLFRNPDRRKAMGRAARERARRQFSPAVIASRFRNEISSACSRPTI